MKLQLTDALINEISNKRGFNYNENINLLKN